ncbi:hypothetical protein H6F43_11845 [Leptolyngbya sp. FACHB-36]|uniref:hypothetical protein n=1 Tax=Leptolyngbya sp. FACHB-36 TaxID=2692808 RepID=UPI001680DB76|nr:hypothetical protein [Leptolyngbya sp. FACHB-36]MBD2020872.1 hypothetical protein [Leptolyngbya sp. FACHB-36]
MADKFVSLSELEAVVEAILRRKLAAMLGVGAPESEWLDASAAYKVLGYPSLKALNDARKSGLYRLGTEVADRRKPGSKKPRYQYHIAMCQQRKQQNPDKRRAI